MKSLYFLCAEIQQLLSEAQHRWLRPAEICEILRNYQTFRISSEPPNRPPSMNFFIIIFYTFMQSCLYYNSGMVKYLIIFFSDKIHLRGLELRATYTHSSTKPVELAASQCDRVW